MYTYMYVCIYIYIERERERENCIVLICTVSTHDIVTAAAAAGDYALVLRKLEAVVAAHVIKYAARCS